MNDTPLQVVPFLGLNKEVIGTATIRPVDSKGRVYADVRINPKSIEVKEKND